MRDEEPMSMDEWHAREYRKTVNMLWLAGGGLLLSIGGIVYLFYLAYKLMQMGW